MLDIGDDMAVDDDGTRWVVEKVSEAYMTTDGRSWVQITLDRGARERRTEAAINCRRQESAMDAKMVRAPQRCLERERMVREWTECSNRLMRLQGEEFAAMRTASSISASAAERIRVAKAANTEACRAYHQHVLEHGCV
jgi:hypothetical protein